MLWASLIALRERSKPQYLFSDLQDSIGEIDNMLNPAQKIEVHYLIIF